MKLNDPPITLSLDYIDENSNMTSSQDRLTITEYKSKDHYCVDGFPKEGD